MKKENSLEIRICVLGMGYVGLPLAVEFGKRYRVLGFDVDSAKVANLRSGIDLSGEISPEKIRSARGLEFSCEANDLNEQDVYIIAVPTPTDANNKPDLSILKSASQMVASVMQQGSVVIIESTVYPGVTDQILVPLLEAGSGFIVNKDFYVGYSPERINPGDPSRGITDTIKITAGSDHDAAAFVDSLYASIITAGTFKATSIVVAEAAKILENVQRDVNIALINEVSRLFNTAGISTREVLEAAGTKWNFVQVKPGLVGGHCIAVDPYYLIDYARRLDVDLPIIVGARKVNQDVPERISVEVEDLLKKRNQLPECTRMLILGFAFKGDCSDIRNTGVYRLYLSLVARGIEVDIYDPEVSRDQVRVEYGIELISSPSKDTYDGIIIAVDHACFKDQGIKEIKRYGNENSVVFDLKGLFPPHEVDFQL